MKKNFKNKSVITIAAILMLISSAKAGAKEVRGKVVSPPELLYNYWIPYLQYYLDTDGDGIADVSMGLSEDHGGAQAYKLLSKYLEQDCIIIFEDKGLKPHENFGAGRMIGFFRPDGTYIALEKILSRDVINQGFPYLREKLGGAKAGSR